LYPPRKTNLTYIIQILTSLALPLAFYEIFNQPNFTQILITTSKNSRQQVSKLIDGCQTWPSKGAALPK
ncbi:MAG: hypothetical protein LUC29_00230, partial [Acidaminococcaceae bacterium]|nr:hypothetical protein [Acidaminococcaceae bacterium]